MRLVFIISIIIFIVLLIVFILRGKKALLIFPDLKNENIIYRDKVASGYSTKSLITKMGGANRTLDIVVTENELWLKSNMLLASIGQKNDLLHKIPLKHIEKAEKNGSKITIDFRSGEGNKKQVVLITKGPDEFIKAINNINYAQQRV